MPTLPNPAEPIADAQGRCGGAWRSFFEGFVGKPLPSVPVAAKPSPMTYRAPGLGTLLVTGGAVTGLTLTRGRAAIPLSAALAAVPMSAGDHLLVTYSGAPVMVFVPA